VGRFVGPITPAYKNLFGEPVPLSLTTPSVALLMISSFTEFFSIPFPSNTAAAPQTCGDAIEVPLMVSYSLFESPIQAALIDDPGAKMSTQFP